MSPPIMCVLSPFPPLVELTVVWVAVGYGGSGLARRLSREMEKDFIFCFSFSRLHEQVSLSFSRSLYPPSPLLLC
jgi:hypothetical protein